MPRCPKGTRKNKKTGECEPITATTKKPRCEKGTRRNKKTGECEEIKRGLSIKSKSSSSRSSVKTPVDTTWKITKIDYIYPSMTSGDKTGISRDDRGIMNIENIYIENETDVAILSLENIVEISLGKKQNTHPKIAWEEESIRVNNAIKQKAIFKNFIYAGLNTDISDIKFSGMENDEDNNNSTTKQNIRDLKNGNFGKYIKINISGNNYGDNLNADNKALVLEEINKFLPNL
jgi:hypothetical protein